MDIDKFLQSMGDSFTAGFAYIDVIGSSRLLGEPKDISKTKTALKDFIESLFGDTPIAILNWQGDGGILIYDGSKGFDDLIILCDKILSLLPFFNQWQGRYNFLKNDRIHLRITCHAGFTENNKNPETLTSDALNTLVHREKEIGVRDHIVVSDEIYKPLSVDITKRLTASLQPDDFLGAYYILDKESSFTAVNQNRISEEIRTWIANKIKNKQYDEIYIFSYTNETLYEYLSAYHPPVKIKVLSRNWLVEEADEKDYNLKNNPPAGTGKLLKPWIKSKTIRSIAETLMGQESIRPFKNEIDLRFYDSPPFLKGVILRNSETGRRAAHIGFYSWDPFRDEGGSPYLGEIWSGIWLIDDDAGSQAVLLDGILSRFNSLWETGKQYEDLVYEDNELIDVTSQQNSVQKIWELDNKPYKLLIPGHEGNGRLYPTVSLEDLNAMRFIETFLLENGADCKFEVIVSEDQTMKINDWDGHVIYICHRTLDESILTSLAQEGFPYSIIISTDGSPESPTKIVHSSHQQEYFSDMDRDPAQKKDYCLIGKADRPNGTGKAFFILGIHAMGTMGGGEYLTNNKKLQSLSSEIGNQNFGCLIQCEFENPWKPVEVHKVTSPETFP